MAKNVSREVVPPNLSPSLSLVLDCCIKTPEQLAGEYIAAAKYFDWTLFGVAAKLLAAFLPLSLSFPEHFSRNDESSETDTIPPLQAPREKNFPPTPYLHFYRHLCHLTNCLSSYTHQSDLVLAREAGCTSRGFFFYTYTLSFSLAYTSTSERARERIRDRIFAPHTHTVAGAAFLRLASSIKVLPPPPSVCIFAARLYASRLAQVCVRAHLWSRALFFFFLFVG